MRNLFLNPISVLLLALSSQPALSEELQSQANALFGPIPSTMPGSENDSAEKIALGKELYFDQRLSVNNSQSCNSCHDVANHGTGVDNKALSPGAIEGAFGTRNSPTVWNAGFQSTQFWDGRAADLTEQAMGPILNPVEMAMPSEQAVVDKLADITEYQDAFNSVFKDDGGLSFYNIAEAIAAFERTLITKDRFDDYMLGDKDALTALEKKGLQTFINTGCAACHNGPLLGGNNLQKMGLVNAYENQSDQGLFDLDNKPASKMLFKTPMLRDVARTAPYFHDGSVNSLEEAIEQMAWLQLGKELSEEETTAISAFLKALTHTF
ncbi:cytochrome-c peroxidase [Sediminihaliea albiluteola]|nr:cytochrome c peroxidase [Sediminihaliea albiluteola]